MSDYFVEDSGLHQFVANLMASKPVIGPVAKKDKFTFERLESVDELRLDYDVTILPPKKAIFPVRQDLVRFSPKGFESAINPQEQVLFGVHFYDIKAIDMLDALFTENKADNNYLANRRATTIIGSSIQTVSSRAFFGSVGTEVKPQGHDAFLTRINGGYVLQIVTAKGEALLAFGKFTAASAAQIVEATKVNEDVLQKCHEKLTHTSAEIAEKVRAQYKNEAFWTECAKDCFSCGACNIVCPTCYCFDVQDEWNIDQVSGVRYRKWDGCLLADFAQVSLGSGGHENFREKSAARFRHRIMRKAAYLNPKLGGPACVGCGRCSIACVPDIADPVRVINKIMDSSGGAK